MTHELKAQVEHIGFLHASAYNDQVYGWLAISVPNIGPWQCAIKALRCADNMAIDGQTSERTQGDGRLGNSSSTRNYKEAI